MRWEGKVDQVSDAPTHAPHWAALDGLRGLAVLGVVAFHLGWINGGFLGVDLFFTLSGFLITTLLMHESEARRRIDLVAFWGRRFRRLLPAVAVMLAVVLAWLSRWGTDAERAVARSDGRWALPYLANWHQITASQDYWASAVTSSPFAHLWSLAIEEQFYVAWPLLVSLVAGVTTWWARRRSRGWSSRRALTVLTVVGASASAVALVLRYDATNPTRTYLGTDTRVCSILLGALVAIVPLGHVGRSATTATQATIVRWASVVVLVAMLASWTVAGNHLPFVLQGGLVLHGIGGALLVRWIVTERAGSRVVCALSMRPLRWVGQRSYGLYLWHWPVIVLVAPRTADLARPLRDALILAISAALTVVSYEIVEQPIRLRRAWARGAAATFATAVTVVFALVAVSIAPDGRGHVASFTLGTSDPPATVDAAHAPAVAAPATPAGTHPDDVFDATRAATNAPSAATRSAAAGIPAVTTGISDGDGMSLLAAIGWAATRVDTAPVRAGVTVHRVLWVGDSLASDEEPAVAAALEAAGLVVVDGSFAGRRLVESGNVDVDTLYPPILDRADADLVIVQLSLWDSPFPLGQQRAAFAWFSDLVLAHGAHLMFVTAPPIRADLIDAGMDGQVGVVAEMAIADPADIQFLDAAPLWGDVVDVDLDDDGAPDRKPDQVHVCPQGAARFAAWLVDQLDARVGGLTPVFPGAWIGGDWSQDERYDTPVGACAALPLVTG